MKHAEVDLHAETNGLTPAKHAAVGGGGAASATAMLLRCAAQASGHMESLVFLHSLHEGMQ